MGLLIGMVMLAVVAAWIPKRTIVQLLYFGGLMLIIAAAAMLYFS